MRNREMSTRDRKSERLLWFSNSSTNLSGRFLEDLEDADEKYKTEV